MRKLFTLLVGLLLTTAFTANAVDVTVYVCTWDDTKGDYEDVAQSFTTYLTKSDDGVFTLQDVTNTGVPLSFKFTDPKINSYSRLTFTGSNLYRAPNYNNYPYLLDAEGKYAVCEYRDPDSSEAFEVYYPLV